MNEIRLKVSEDDASVAYVYLPEYPQKSFPGLSRKQIDLSSLIDDYKGPQVILDFNASNVLIGIEIIG